MAGMRLIKGNWGPIMTILITRLAAPTVTLHNQRRHALVGRDSLLRCIRAG